ELHRSVRLPSGDQLRRHARVLDPVPVVRVVDLPDGLQAENLARLAHSVCCGGCTTAGARLWLPRMNPDPPPPPPPPALASPPVPWGERRPAGRRRRPLPPLPLWTCPPGPPPAVLSGSPMLGSWPSLPLAVAGGPLAAPPPPPPPPDAKIRLVDCVAIEAP